MKTLKLEIITNIYDEDFYKVIDTKHKYSATYTGDINIPKLETDLYSLLGEGIRVSTNHSDNVSIISIELFGDRSIDKLLDYLSPYAQIDDNHVLYEHFSNIDFDEYFQFSTSNEYLSQAELDALEKIFKEEGIRYKILSGNDIYEKGASSIEISYLIGIAGSLTAELTMRLLKAIKSKVFDEEKTDTTKIQVDVKNRLLNDYNLKPSEIYLSCFYTRQDGMTELTFQSEKDEFKITVDSKGNIVKLDKCEKKQGQFQVTLVADEVSLTDVQTLPTVVILTAITEEYNAVEKHLTDKRTEKRAGTIYEKGIFSHNSRNIANVIIRECGDKNVNASLETERAIANFKPDCMLFVGIAGSIKPHDFDLGDVIFPTKICYYEGGKAEKEEFKVRPDCVQPEYTLEELAKHERRNSEWKNLILNKSDKTKNVKANLGVIASGEKILDHIRTEVGKVIKSGYNDTAVIEMEGFGFARAITRQGTEKKIKYGVVRGISDIVELNDEEGESVNRRTDNAKQIASDTAAAFAYWLIYKLYEDEPLKLAEAKPGVADKVKSHMEELEEKKLRLSVKPRLKMNGGSSRGFDGELQLNILNKGEIATLKAFRVIEGNVFLHNEHLPYELEKDAERKIFLRTKDKTNSNIANYKVEIEYEDALNFNYISTIEGTGAKCKLIETKEL